MNIQSWLDNKRPSFLEKVETKITDDGNEVMSIAKSKAETRQTYRSVTSKLDRRRNKHEALINRLKSDCKDRNLSGQADIALQGNTIFHKKNPKIAKKIKSLTQTETVLKTKKFKKPSDKTKSEDILLTVQKKGKNRHRNIEKKKKADLLKNLAAMQKAKLN